MNQAMRYAGAALLVLALAIAALWPWLDARGRAGVVGAAIVAYPVQVAAFAFLIRFRERVNRFLAVWAGGTLLRILLIGLAAVVVARIPWIAPAPALLALAGFFFGLLLLEPFFFRLGVQGTVSRS